MIHHRWSESNGQGKKRRCRYRNKAMKSHSKASTHPPALKSCPPEYAARDGLPHLQRIDTFRCKKNIDANSVKESAQETTKQDCPERIHHSPILNSTDSVRRSDSAHEEHVQVISNARRRMRETTLPESGKLRRVSQQISLEQSVLGCYTSATKEAAARTQGQ